MQPCNRATARQGGEPRGLSYPPCCAGKKPDRRGEAPYLLPGGRVIEMEDSLTAIKREIKEELNILIKEFDERVDNLINLTEKLFDYSKALDTKDKLNKENI